MIYDVCFLTRAATIFCSLLTPDAQATFVFLTFTLNGTPTEVMVSADRFRGKDQPPVRGFAYGSITAAKEKEKLKLLDMLDVMLCKDLPTPEAVEEAAAHRFGASS